MRRITFTRCLRTVNWKFNDEKGASVTDHVNGNNLKADHEFLWVSLELPEK